LYRVGGTDGRMEGLLDERGDLVDMREMMVYYWKGLVDLKIMVECWIGLVDTRVMIGMRLVVDY